MSALSQSLEFVVNSTSTVAVHYPNTASSVLVFVSDKAKGDGYYASSDGLHTVTYTATQEFVGTVTMQATLATSPENKDWFNVPGTTSTYTAFDTRTTSTVDYYNFTGNFVWVRGHISIEAGAVEVIHYNH